MTTGRRLAAVAFALALPLAGVRDACAGLVLEGIAQGFEKVRTAVYRPAQGKERFHHIIWINDKVGYLPPIPMRDFVVLCRALARDDRVGVSLGAVEIVYGAVPKDADLGVFLKLADMFLADIVFAGGDWSAGYRLADGFVPRQETVEGDVALFLKLKDVRFRVKNDLLVLEDESLEVQLVPLATEKAKNGGHLPDFAAIRASKRFPAYEANARHLAAHAPHYKRELVVQRAYDFGEVAALLRKFKKDGVNLAALADSIETVFGEKVAPVFPRQSLERHWADYLKKIQGTRYDAHWDGPPYDFYIKRKAAARRAAR